MPIWTAANSAPRTATGPTAKPPVLTIAKSIENNHGRIDTRSVRVCDQGEHLGKVASDWPGSAAVVAVRSRRELSDGRVMEETRLLSTSVKGLDARRTGEPVRGHGSVENNLNGQLDVSLDEDQRRIRKVHGAENFSRLCRPSVNPLKTDKAVQA